MLLPHLNFKPSVFSPFIHSVTYYKYFKFLKTQTRKVNFVNYEIYKYFECSNPRVQINLAGKSQVYSFVLEI